MKSGRMQAKDISDRDFLLGILYVKWKKWDNREYATSSTWDVQRYLADELQDIRPWLENEPTWNQPSTLIPPRLDWEELDKVMPYKLVVAKARALIRRGLIDGCECGCRGDFMVTVSGYRFLVGESIGSRAERFEESFDRGMPIRVTT